MAETVHVMENVPTLQHSESPCSTPPAAPPLATPSPSPAAPSLATPSPFPAAHTLPASSPASAVSPTPPLGPPDQNGLPTYTSSQLFTDTWASEEVDDIFKQHRLPSILYHLDEVERLGLIHLCESQEMAALEVKLAERRHRQTVLVSRTTLLHFRQS